MTRARLDLESSGQSDILEVGLESFQQLRALAEHIESRGDFHRFKLYSVDAHLAQRFLNDHECIPFARVQWSPDEPARLLMCPNTSEREAYPPFHVVKLSVKRTPGQGLPTLQDTVEWFRFETVHEPGSHHGNHSIVHRQTYRTRLHVIHDGRRSSSVQCDGPGRSSHGGWHQRWFPWLVEQGRLHGQPMVLGEQGTASANDQPAYGPFLRSNAPPTRSFFNGRLHIDLKNSFIVSEGGLAGLFELAQHSRQSAQIISRLSPGSVISAIQMRVAMDDGVLVPEEESSGRHEISP